MDGHNSTSQCSSSERCTTALGCRNWLFGVVLSALWLVARAQSKTILTDENGGEWAVGAGNGDFRPSSRIDQVLTRSCPSQSYASTGIRGNDIIYLENAQTSSYGPNATMDFLRDRHNTEFTISLALVPRTNSNGAWFRTLITWVNGFDMHYKTVEHGPIENPCEIALHESTLNAGLDIAGRRDLPLGTIAQVTVMPSNGSIGLFVLNMTMEAAVDDSNTGTESTTTPIDSNPPSSPTASPSSSPSDNSSSSTSTSSISSLTVSLPSVGDPPQAPGTTPGPSSPTSSTEESPSSSDGHPFPIAAAIAIAATLFIALSVLVVVIVWLLRRRRRRQHAPHGQDGIASYPLSSPEIPIYEADPLIAPYRLVQTTPGASSFELLQQRTKEKPFPDVRAVDELSETSGSNSTGAYSDAGEGEIVRAVRRAGLTTQALLRSLDMMVPESDSTDGGAGTLPPDYARVV